MTVILDGIRVRVFLSSKKAQHYRTYDWHFKGCGYGNFLGKGISFVGWASLLLSLGLRVGSVCGSSATKSGGVPGRLSRFRGKISVLLGEHLCCFHSTQPELSLFQIFMLSQDGILGSVPGDQGTSFNRLLNVFSLWPSGYLCGSLYHRNMSPYRPSRHLLPRELCHVLVADFIVCLTWGKTHYFLKSQLECVPWSL